MEVVRGLSHGRVVQKGARRCPLLHKALRLEARLDRREVQCASGHDHTAIRSEGIGNGLEKMPVEKIQDVFVATRTPLSYGAGTRADSMMTGGSSVDSAS